MISIGKKQNAFSLVELLIVVLVIAVLSAIAVPAFLNVQRRMQDNDAKANLELIQAAEEFHNVDMQQYVACSDPTDCNDTLELDLPPCATLDECRNNSRWFYRVTTTGNPPDAFVASAQGLGTTTWRLDENDACPHGADGTNQAECVVN